MSKFTVFGGRGFIGSEFVKELRTQGHDVFVPEREDLSIYEDDLGTVIYSAGYGDCQRDQFNVLTANVILLSSLLQKAKFDKLVYISSTRVYMNQNESSEYSDVTICSKDNRRLFNLTKLTAEELCLKSERECLIIRPSNVYGLALNSNLFLPSIIRNAIKNKHIDMYVDKNYEKDYVSVYDVVSSTLKLIKFPQEVNKIINISSGENISANDIAQVLINKTGCSIKWKQTLNNTECFSPIDISYLKSLIDYKPRTLINDINNMVDSFIESI
ncbi:dTDP-glucose-4,6-dehydratase [Aliivibrio fischeri ES114]|uniref:dTDP-glucose-4,6-dehydratase n=1 Tax=Aliivibrio fischeri (strain ATCC 700601 / ES114) TaxID=312309 RepID=Q5E8I2_ALIF1|nr:NAD(P)-dependent oxidoreductase [Aliivibrio fischeri]AAW84664.1 dTDP-glucose-4,6-dehydratase [Aliivibrio fischeri ES114]KLU78886.1 dTDP-glucose 4,6-dehydratase [Aliivibrio fischeri]